MSDPSDLLSRARLWPTDQHELESLHHAIIQAITSSHLSTAKSAILILLGNEALPVFYKCYYFALLASMETDEDQKRRFVEKGKEHVEGIEASAASLGIEKRRVEKVRGMLRALSKSW